MVQRMGSERILIDTSILIDYFRKKNIEKTLFYQLADKYDFSISVITEFEFLIGFSDDKVAFAKEIIKNMEIIEIDTGISEKARHLYFKLKKINKLIPIGDLFIAATALYYKIPFATLNKKHFENIEGLDLL